MNHDQLAYRVETLSMASGILAGISAAVAALLDPSGFDAFIVWTGIADEPLIVAIAPYFGILATFFGTLSGFTFFYAKWRNRSQQATEPADQ